MQNTRRKVIHTCCCSDNQSSESITSHLVSSKCFDDCSTISVIPAGNQKSHVIFLHKLKLCNRQTSRQQLCKELFTFDNILTDQFFLSYGSLLYFMLTCPGFRNTAFPQEALQQQGLPGARTKWFIVVFSLSNLTIALLETVFWQSGSILKRQSFSVLNITSALLIFQILFEISLRPSFFFF